MTIEYTTCPVMERGGEHSTAYFEGGECIWCGEPAPYEPPDDWVHYEVELPPLNGNRMWRGVWMRRSETTGNHRAAVYRRIVKRQHPGTVLLQRHRARRG